mmetsp:Transcript_3792/g.4355  ORF Transcript_3792/g.4355 Transcript_3792/m.4355 type:complete len:171 (+) Transcript_3792:1096-1608(+)
MCVEDFQKEFGYFGANLNTTKMKHDYFLKLNDTTKPNGTKSWCGAKCTRHKIAVWSKVAQQVYVTANTWDNRGSPGKCNEKATHPLKSSIGPAPSGSYFTFHYDSRQLPAMEFKENEMKYFSIELDFSDPKLPKDWSVTAWGASGDALVYHMDGLQTDHFKDVSTAPAPL